MTDYLDELERLEQAATPAPWRVEDAHDLWREIRHGYGISSRMVADCLRAPDGPLIASARNALPRLIAELRALRSVFKEAKHVRLAYELDEEINDVAVDFCAALDAHRLSVSEANQQEEDHHGEH